MLWCICSVKELPSENVDTSCMDFKYKSGEIFFYISLCLHLSHLGKLHRNPLSLVVKRSLFSLLNVPQRLPPSSCLYWAPAKPTWPHNSPSTPIAVRLSSWRSVWRSRPLSHRLLPVYSRPIKCFEPFFFMYLIILLCCWCFGRQWMLLFMCYLGTAGVQSESGVNKKKWGQEKASSKREHSSCQFNNDKPRTQREDRFTYMSM